MSVIALIAAACAHSGPPQPGTFSLSRGALACIQEAGTDPAEGERPCLRIGELRVGAAYPEVAKLLPPESERRALQDEAWAHVFVLDEATGTYAVIVERGGRVQSVQLTGGPGSQLDFSGVRLGDTTAQLEDRLGRPGRIRPGDDYELWSYAPYPFSFEVRGGRVASMKVFELGP